MWLELFPGINGNLYIWLQFSITIIFYHRQQKNIGLLLEQLLCRSLVLLSIDLMPHIYQIGNEHLGISYCNMTADLTDALKVWSVSPGLKNMQQWCDPAKTAILKNLRTLDNRYQYFSWRFLVWLSGGHMVNSGSELVNRSSKRSYTRGMIHNKIHLVSLGCQHSIASQYRIVA